jgi:hypothetical protein
MTDAVLNRMRDLIQEDVGNRGLRTDPGANLVTACAGDFATACRCLAEAACPSVAVVTGFLIPHAQPPCHETDGPLGAVFLARALVPLGIPVALVTEADRRRPLEEGLKACGLFGRDGCRVVGLPGPAASLEQQGDFWRQLRNETDGPQPYLIALERAGPSHTLYSLARQGGSGELREEFQRLVPADHRDQYHTMRGRIITDRMRPAHLLFEEIADAYPPAPTIGIGDGGNEIGMGKIPWDVIRRNVPNGGLVACRVPTDYLIVCGVSNWGAYALGAGVRLLRGAPSDPDLFDPEREREILRIMVERGPLVDGVSGVPSVSVDGLPFDRYIEPLRRLAEMT